MEDRAKSDLSTVSVMKAYKIPLADETGNTIGYGDRWWTHRVKDTPGGPVLGQKHVGITIACIDDRGRILTQHRKHRIFDKVWSLSGDTHPRKYEGRKVESLSEAAKRCASEDLGVTINTWSERLSLPYSARDPRDPRYCENEQLYILVANYVDPLRMNKDSAYELRWISFKDILKDSRVDLKKPAIARKYAPWVHALFSLPATKVEEALLQV